MFLSVKCVLENIFHMKFENSIFVPFHINKQTNKKKKSLFKKETKLQSVFQSIQYLLQLDLNIFYAQKLTIDNKWIITTA